MIFPSNKISNYELLDHGNERKLERFGNLVTDRPEPAATWAKSLSKSEWQKADAVFSEQKIKKEVGIKNSQIGIFLIHLKNLKSTSSLVKERLNISAYFEQAENWEFIRERCSQLLAKGITPNFLNLFAYTGGASLAADLAGAEVTHIDSVKSVVNWARENAELNNIDSIRWIVEDAPTFVEKEIRRGNQYHGIIMDPPIFGLGPKGGRWKLNRDLPNLLENAMKLLDSNNRFFILNTYSPQLSLHDLNKMLSNISGFPRNYEATELGLKSATGKELPLGNLVRF